MSSRISSHNRDTAPRHHEITNWILRLTADLMILVDDGWPLRADQSRLMEWSTHRRELEECEEPLILYGPSSHYHQGTVSRHSDLILTVTNLVVELKLLNAGKQTGYTITMDEIKHVRELAMKLDDCRKRIVFY